MSKLMSREGYYTNKANKAWTKKELKIGDLMRKFIIDFYKAGGSVPEALHCLQGEVWRAEQNAKHYLIFREGPYQKSLRAKRKKRKK